MKSPVNLGDLSRAYAAFSTRLHENNGDDVQVDKVRVGLDSLSSAELQSLAKIQARFSSPSSARDLLRLPRIAEMTDQEISGAFARIAAMGEPLIGTTETDAGRERQMRVLVKKIAGALASIPRKPHRPV